MSSHQANNLKNKYITALQGPGMAAAVLGAGTGAAVLADKAINSEANHAATMTGVVKEAYGNNPELAQAASFIYGNATSNIAPVHVQSVAEILSNRGSGLDAEILDVDHPGMMDRIEQLMEARPELAEQVGMIETLHASAIVKSLAGGHGIEDAYTADPANSVVPMIGGALAGAGTAAAINHFR